MQTKQKGPTTDANFAHWLAGAGEEQLFTEYAFALCCDVPPGDEEGFDRRVKAVRGRMEALHFTGEAFLSWHNVCYERYVADPVHYVERVKEEYEKNRLPALLSLEGVQAQAVPWLLPGALARGEISLLGADGGTGKGLVQAGIIASVTTGKPCAFWEGIRPEAPGNVLIFPGEDDPARVLRPRLVAAGADLSRVRVMTPELFYRDKQQTLTLDSEAFRRYLLGAKPAPALIVLDPLQSFLPATVDMARRNEMRAALTPLRTACEQTGAAGLVVLHTNKKAGVAGRQRLADSSDLWDFSRAVYMMGRDPQQKGVVYLSNEKNNYAPPRKTALLAIESVTAEGVPTAAARFVGLTDKRDADFAAQKTARTAVTKLAVEDAILDELNASPTACLRAEVLRQRVMESTGCSEATYKRARSELSNTKEIINKKLRTKNGVDVWYVFRYGTETEDARVSASTAVI